MFEEFRAAMKRAARASRSTPPPSRGWRRRRFSSENDAKGVPHAHLQKELIGKDVSVLAAAAGVQAPAGAPLLFGETAEDHVFVQEEQMMPFVPIVRVRDVDAAIAASVKAEHGYRHTAIIHSRNMENVTKMARAIIRRCSCATDHASPR